MLFECNVSCHPFLGNIGEYYFEGFTCDIGDEMCLYLIWELLAVAVIHFVECH